MTNSDSLRTYKWKQTRLKVLNRDQHTCYYCGNDATQVDHVIPRAKGGTDSLDNLVAACATCNNSKGDRAKPVFLSAPLLPMQSAGNLSPVKYYRIMSAKVEK